MRTYTCSGRLSLYFFDVGMKPLSERDENFPRDFSGNSVNVPVGMKPLSERDENLLEASGLKMRYLNVGMKPLSERDENRPAASSDSLNISNGRNEATL